MKAGLITFHITPSMGGNLQGFALYEAILKLGYDCEIIDYRRDYELNLRKTVSKKTVKQKLVSSISSVSNMITKKDDEKRRERIKDFQEKYLKISERSYHTIDELKQNPPIYDVYVTGSDQVWNPVVYHLEPYFLTFAPKNKNTVAYAPSIGISKIGEENKEYLKKNTQSVRHLSCREDIGSDILRDITGREVTHVLDPTLLLDKMDWEKYAEKDEQRKPYLLCYFLGSLEYGRKVAKRIAKEKGLEVIIIPENPKDLLSFAKKEKGIGPEQFLELFKNADYICTDSFHGTAFSINFNKPFISFCRRNNKGENSNISRIESIVRILGCEERLIENEDQYNEGLLTMEYTEINKKLEEQRNISLDYLKRSLKDE